MRLIYDTVGVEACTDNNIRSYFNLQASDLASSTEHVPIVVSFAQAPLYIQADDTLAKYARPTPFYRSRIFPVFALPTDC